ncbi:hypothetical protein E2C01_059467 [Portunus trituberculatus]|uniref:Uncharacterized protein n=1 Tax=Portunus trituberculatus TaxID=210409 RepID=A0A5B7H951_PORTR|nr:hypothetical protein [Portunus trituberculatus]
MEHNGNTCNSTTQKSKLDNVPFTSSPSFPSPSQPTPPHTSQRRPLGGNIFSEVGEGLRGKPRHEG